MTDHVGLDFPQTNALVRERAGGVPLVEEIGGIRLVDEDLQRATELLAVVQDAGMCIRNAPRADVDVLALVKCADLTFPADLGVLASATDGPRQSTHAIAGFEDPEVIPEL